MVRVFFSYSHRDEDLRDELEIHLSILKRQGVIEPWHDRRIGAGKDFGDEINSNIERANIILLLVSPYFLDSDYCYDIEMERALERHNDGSARVIPVILHPCDWQTTPFGKLRAIPPDGKPISKYPNQHDAFLNITKEIRQIAEEMSSSQKDERQTVNAEIQGTLSGRLKTDEKPRSSNLRMRKEFTDIQKSQFLTETFEYIANFFENSLNELAGRTAGIESEFNRIDMNSFSAKIYRNGQQIGQCKISRIMDSYSSGEIRYSSSLSSYDNSYNESLSIDDDGFTLGIKPLGMYKFRVDREKLLTQEGGAELLWNMLISPFQ